MNDRTTFETRVAALFDTYASAAPVEVDAPALATTILRRERHIVRILGRTFVRPRWFTPVLVAVLLLLALATAVLIGSALLRVRSPIYNTLKAQAAAFMSQQRDGGAAVRLADGRVLVVGGRNPYAGGTTSYAEIYDPTTGAFEPTSLALPATISGLAASALNDGRVLVTGGYEDSLEASSVALLFDPATSTSVQLPPMLSARANHASVLMPNGLVVLIGGVSDKAKFTLADPVIEVFDPASLTFVRGPDVSPLKLESPLAFPVGGARVAVVAGGTSLPIAVVDTTTGQVIGSAALDSDAGTQSIVAGATMLNDGRIAVIVDGQALGQDEIIAFTPTSTAVRDIASLSGQLVIGPVTLADGRLLAGMVAPDDCQRIFAEVFDPVDESSTRIGQITGIGTCTQDPRATITALTNGGVLIAGGYMSFGTETSAATLIRP